MLSFNTFKTTVLLGVLTGLLVAIGWLLGGSYGMMLGFIIAIAMNFGSYWFSDTIALKMTGGKEVSYQEAPELHDIISRLAKVSGLPKPRVAIVEADAPNAFATGRNAVYGRWHKVKWGHEYV
jgi:heat shock protein HtpX